MDLVKNFSDRRMSHMREVAKVLLAEKVQRILTERAAANTVQNEPITKETPATTPAHVEEKVAAQATESVRRTTSMAEEQARQLEEEKRKLEAENRAQEILRERAARERAARREQQRREEEQAGGGFPKKAIGIAVAAVTVAVVLFLLLK